MILFFNSLPCLLRGGGIGDSVERKIRLYLSWCLISETEIRIYKLICKTDMLR